MSLWIKICGNTSLTDAQVAVSAGADALGFVFAPSPRQVTVDLVAKFIEELPPTVEKIGVFVHPPLEEVVHAIRGARLTGVQIHAGGGEELAARLRKEFGPRLRILRVVHFNADAVGKATAFASDPNVDAILVDSHTARALGGTGIAFDWASAALTVFRVARERKMRIIAAGGLNPANVAEAVKMLRPWGVDVVSGVEGAPGHKDPDKVRAFVENARVITTRKSRVPY